MLVAASLFGDGASACVVAQPTANATNYFRLEQFHSAIKPDTGDEMVWTIGDYGFQLHLSPRIPQHLAEAAPQSLAQLFELEQPTFWAIHPGGRAILDRLAQIFALDDAQMRPSREVLRRVGNVSSATLLFVLDEVCKQVVAKRMLHNGDAEVDGEQDGCQGVAMAFGPGLVVEMARLRYVANQPVPLPLYAHNNSNALVSQR
jgi:predicted naringenin-chalcone synthase